MTVQVSPCSHLLPFRLCLVCVKAFPENIPFSGKYFLVFGKCYKEKDKTRKTNTAPRLTLAIDWVRRRSASRAPVRRLRRRSRSREAPRRSRSARRRVRDLGSRLTTLVLANGADWSLDVRTAPTGYASPSRALTLSLSLSSEFI